MNISENGKNLIKSFEGCSLKSYKVIEGEKYYTIGYGHYGADVLPNMVITQSQADKYFNEDIKVYVNAVNNFKFSFTPNQNQFDSLVSFCYNLGINILNDFTGLSANQIANEMLLYNKSCGVVLTGLVNRRKKEVELFNTPIFEIEREVKRYKESGTFKPNTKIYFRNNPLVSNNNPIQGYYTIGESVNYDLVVITNFYVYISWSNSEGIRRYMPIREIINDKMGSIWGSII